MEKEFNDNKNINMDLVHKLNTLYQTAVEYYSAINSPQFQIFTEKIKNLMGTKQISELMDKSIKQEQTYTTNSETPLPKKNEKEEKIITQGLNKIKSTINSFSGKKDQKKEQKKVTKPKVSISKEDEDGGTLDVGSDDDEEDEEEEDEKEKKPKEEEKKSNDIQKEEKDKKIQEESKNEEKKEN